MAVKARRKRPDPVFWPPPRHAIASSSLRPTRRQRPTVGLNAPAPLQPDLPSQCDPRFAVAQWYIDGNLKMSHSELDLSSPAALDVDTTMVITFLSLIDGGFAEDPDVLAETAAQQCGVDVPRAASVLQRYTGPNFGEHYWRLRQCTGSHSIYEVLPPR